MVDVVSCGTAAVLALRALLFEREPSGLYQVRCRAVAALAALHAYDVLFEFLRADRNAVDPVERLGDDAVINAAALALANVADEKVFRLLLALAKRPVLTGVIAAMGSFGRAESIPALIDALEDDASRPTAIMALKKIGARARSALAAAAKLRTPSEDRESVSSLRRRRSALRLLIDMGQPGKIWPELRCLMGDEDAIVSTLACKLCFSGASPHEVKQAIHRLIALLPDADWVLRDEIADCLVERFEVAEPIIAAYLRANIRPGNAAENEIERVLLRVRARAEAAQP